jgi:hypothetical protein
MACGEACGPLPCCCVLRCAASRLRLCGALPRPRIYSVLWGEVISVEPLPARAMGWTGEPPPFFPSADHTAQQRSQLDAIIKDKLFLTNFRGGYLLGRRAAPRSAPSTGQAA